MPASVAKDPYEVPVPAYRRLKIFTHDPSLRTRMATVNVNQTTVQIPWEVDPYNPNKDGPAPGPIGEYVEVIDYDPGSGCFYQPIDLNNERIAASNGLDPSETNPQFHQQMVYAVAMQTIGAFERALGRKALWSPRRFENQPGKDEYVGKLRIYPHGLREPNAYYHPDKKALLFGYFAASDVDPSVHMPGGMVFTCLSHDIIAHETAHALLDGLHRRFVEPSNPDALAFHEAFADIIAIFQHFSFPEVVLHEMQRVRGNLDRSKLLSSLAQEFGTAIGRSEALRSAIGEEPDPARLAEAMEPHDRGAILVAAVFRAFLNIYRERTEDLFRIATNGLGKLPDGYLLPDLARRLTREAVKSARHVLTICIRALDYLPPVDVDFGDYLRAIITADYDLVPDDAHNYRVAFIEAFRSWGIYPRNVRTLSEESLLLRGSEKEDAELDEVGRQVRDAVAGWNLTANRKSVYDSIKQTQRDAHGILKGLAEKYGGDLFKGVDLSKTFEVHSIRPLRRVGPDGQERMDVLVEITQRRPGSLEEGGEWGEIPKLRKYEHDFWFRGGCTLIIDRITGRIRYCVYRDINSYDRYLRHAAHLRRLIGSGSLGATYFDGRGAVRGSAAFSALHRFSHAEVG